RTLALARLARYAEDERLFHPGRGQGLRPELAAERQPQAVGPPARDVLLLQRRLVARAHHRLELPALPVVVAHLRRGEEPAALGPVERGADGQRAVAGLVAEEGAVIHLRRAHDLARIEQAPGIEDVLHLLEGADDALPEHHLVELGAAQAVAVLTRMR